MIKSAFPNKSERHNAGKRLSLLLREMIESLGIAHDQYGFANIEDIVRCMKQYISDFSVEHLLEIVNKDPQHRFDIRDQKIRAKAGHRFHVEIPWPPICPPKMLFHGTCEDAENSILQQGVLTMGKSYVHLASTRERATRIGRRKSKSPILLEIEASAAFEAGIKFWKSGQVSSDGEIYLSEEIPPQFVRRDKQQSL